LEKFVGITGQVVGVDYDPEMIERAREKAKEAGVSHYVIHEVADATSLPFDDNAFHGSRSERLFQHVFNSVQVLSEMIRVTGSGGWVVVADTDHGSVALDVANIDLEWRFRGANTEVYNNGRAARQLYGMFKRAGLANVQVSYSHSSSLIWRCCASSLSWIKP
jgi:ubiquinone/menaquinone biosynthesis C-methylase UbiE